MKQIDFIPAWYRARRRRKRNLIVRAASLGVLGVVMLLISVGHYVRLSAARANLAELQASFDGQAAVIEGLNKLEARLDELRQKQVLLAEAAGGAPLHGVVAELSHLMPDALALTAFSVIRERRIGEPGATGLKGGDRGGAERPVDGGDGVIEITGWAASDVNVGSLMTNMTRSRLFSDVTLRYSKPVVVNDREAREFILTSRMPQFE